MTPSIKGKLLQTSGLVVIGIGLYLIMLGNEYDDDGDAYFKPRPPDDNIIDAEWYEVD